MLVLFLTHFGGFSQLERYMLEALKESRLSFGEVKMAATPRRLIVMVKDLESQQEDTVTEVKKGEEERRRDRFVDGEMDNVGLCTLMCLPGERTAKENRCR